jgi:transglutaminase/protease-like cytokinesis protein 3
MIGELKLKLYFLITILFFVEAKAENVDPTTFNYSKVDSVALAIGKYQFNTIESLSAYINKNFTTDHERLRAIFIWITNNIEYSYSHLHADEEAVFRTKKAVCNGYSILLKQLCDNSNIKCRVITGWAKDSFNSIDTTKQENGHAWNIVNLYNEDYLIDATWAAGGFNRENIKFIKEFKNEYYLGKPQYFILTHFPHITKVQLLVETVSFEDFIKTPVIEIYAVDNNIKFIPENLFLQTKYRFGNEFIFTTDEEIHLIEMEITYINSSLSHFYTIEFQKHNNQYSFVCPFEYYGNFNATFYINSVKSITYNINIE